MTEAVVGGPPDPVALDWRLLAGSDFRLPLRWKDGAGASLDLTSALVVVTFSAGARATVIPAQMSSAGVNGDGAQIALGNAAAPANMTVTIPAAATLGYRFQQIGYAMTVTYGGQTLRWAQGFVRLDALS